MHKYYPPVGDSSELLLLCQEKHILLPAALQDPFCDLPRKKGIKRQLQNRKLLSVDFKFFWNAYLNIQLTHVWWMYQKPLMPGFQTELYQSVFPNKIRDITIPCIFCLQNSISYMTAPSCAWKTHRTMQKPLLARTTHFVLSGPDPQGRICTIWWHYVIYFRLSPYLKSNCSPFTWKATIGIKITPKLLEVIVHNLTELHIIRQLIYPISLHLTL